MAKINYSYDFKRDAVHQLMVWGYPVREFSRTFGVSTYSPYKSMKLFGKPAPKPGVDHETENRQLKRELARVSEESDICNDPLKTCSCYKEENSNEYDHGREHQTLDSEAQSSACYRDHSGLKLRFLRPANPFLTPSEFESWLEDAKKGIENLLWASQLDFHAQYEK